MYLVVKELVAAFGGQQINTEMGAGFQGDVHKGLGGVLAAGSVLPIGSCCRKLRIGAVGAQFVGKCVAHGAHGAD